MPDGRSPVPGLSVLLLDRTEQRSPRFEWAQSHDVMWAAEVQQKHRHLDRVVTSMLTREGLENSGQPRDYEFSFEAYDTLLLASLALYRDPHWPPASVLDAPAVALARPHDDDVLLAIRQAPER